MVQSRSRGNGNSPKDEQWIEWMKENGELKAIDPDEEGVPWPAMSKWSGLAEDKGNPWQIPPPHAACAGKAYVRDVDGNYIMDSDDPPKRIMRPCWNWPMKGSTVCIKHGGGIERVRRGAMDRLVSALDVTTGRLIQLALDPGTEDKVRLGAINSIMDRAGVKGGVEVDLKVPGWQEALREMFAEKGITEE